MERIFTSGVIYRVIKYTDNSAIALGYTKEFGKLKLFMPKAYTKKSGLLTIVPGEIDFLKKDNSDLYKLYDFKPNSSFLNFVEDPALSLRFSLIYDLFDNLYDVGQPEPVLWTMLTRFTRENASSALIFTLYALLKNSGNMFSNDFCSLCGKAAQDESSVLNGDYFCGDCTPQGAIRIGCDENLVLRAVKKPNLYKNLKISLHLELAVCEILLKHAEAAIGKKIKSFQTFKTLLLSL